MWEAISQIFARALLLTMLGDQHLLVHLVDKIGLGVDDQHDSLSAQFPGRTGAVVGCQKVDDHGPFAVRGSYQAVG